MFSWMLSFVMITLLTWMCFRRAKSNPASTPRVRLALESLEDRAVPSAASSFVYTETENFNPGQNAVIAYSQNGTGPLTQIGSYSTGGTGFPFIGLGPIDSDKEVIASPDGRFLFAVNQGSNSVATFLVQPDGSLALVNGAATPSGGTQPVSLTIDDGRLYVLNRGDEVSGQPATIAPNITVFNIGSDGTLTQIGADTTTLPLGLSPSQVLTIPTPNLVFVDAFTPGNLTAVQNANELLSFQLGANGQLTPASGAAADISGTPTTVLGLSLNPTQNIIYSGLGGNQVGVFSFDDAGNLTFDGAVPDSLGGTAPCWTTVSPNGQYLYTADTGTDSVAVYSLANPLHPTQVQEFALGGPLNSTPTGAVSPGHPRETTDFEFSFDPSGSFLSVINHQTGIAGDFPDGNALHVLSVNPTNGTLSEATDSPAFLPGGIPLNADPQGVAVIAAPGPGATVVGNSLYLVGGNTNDQLNITPIGASQTGSTGIQVTGQLNNVNVNQTYPQGFTTIYVVGLGGNDNVHFAGSLTVTTVISEGNGNDNVQLGNGSNTITLGNGNDNVQAGGGSNTVLAGNGNNNVHLGNGNFDAVWLGNGNNNVQAGNGNFDAVWLGNGNDNVQAGNGNFDAVTLGNGNNNVQAGNGNFDAVWLGNGNDNVQIGNGSSDSVTLGNGNDNVQAGNGTSNVLTLGRGHDKVQAGNGWEIL